MARLSGIKTNEEVDYIRANWNQVLDFSYGICPYPA